jgi:hypothetical protein
LQVLFEDRHLIIIDKPAGLLSEPTPDRECDTLRERTGRYLQLRYGGRPYLGVVHRLDKDTSGALVFARSPEALRALQALFKAHTIERQYLAVVEGSPQRDAGRIDLPLVVDRDGRRHGVARGDALPRRRAVREQCRAHGLPARDRPDPSNPHPPGRLQTADRGRSRLSSTLPPPSSGHLPSPGPPRPNPGLHPPDHRRPCPRRSRDPCRFRRLARRAPQTP